MNAYRQLLGTVAAREPSGAGDDGDISLAQLWAVIVRRRWLVVATALLATLAASLIAALTVPVYQSSATVRIDAQNSGVPVLDVLQKLGAGSTQEIFTEMEVLRSRRLAEAVVQRLQMQLSARTPYQAGRRLFFVVPPHPVAVASFAEEVSFAVGAPGSSWKVHRNAGGVLTFARTSPGTQALEVSGRTGDVILGGHPKPFAGQISRSIVVTARK